MSPQETLVNIPRPSPELTAQARAPLRPSGHPLPSPSAIPLSHEAHLLLATGMNVYGQYTDSNECLWSVYRLKWSHTVFCQRHNKQSSLLKHKPWNPPDGRATDAACVWDSSGNRSRRIPHPWGKATQKGRWILRGWGYGVHTGTLSDWAWWTSEGEGHPLTPQRMSWGCPGWWCCWACHWWRWRCAASREERSSCPLPPGWSAEGREWAEWAHRQQQ